MRTRWLGAICLVVTALAGCGGGASAPKAGSPEGAVEAAVRAYSSAVVSGNGAAGYQLISVRCQKVIDAGAFDAQATQAKANYPGATIKKISVDDLSGSTAHVSYSYQNAVLDQSKKAWVNEAGGWRWDAC